MNQSAKADRGKYRPSLAVLQPMVRAICYVREYGITKYHDPDNWRNVSEERYREALVRHVLAFNDDPEGMDDESGLPHLWHAACNIMFILALQVERFWK